MEGRNWTTSPILMTGFNQLFLNVLSLFLPQQPTPFSSTEQSGDQGLQTAGWDRLVLWQDPLAHHISAVLLFTTASILLGGQLRMFPWRARKKAAVGLRTELCSQNQRREALAAAAGGWPGSKRWDAHHMFRLETCSPLRMAMSNGPIDWIFSWLDRII